MTRTGTPPGTLHLLVPGALGQRTGGYIYDARMADGLRRLGWQVVVSELDGDFPGPDRAASAGIDATLEGIPDAAVVLIDGLACGAHPAPIRRQAGRLRVVVVVHHPLADETGLGAERRELLRTLERQTLASCAGAIVTSAFTATRLEAFGLPADRIRVAQPGVDRAVPARGPEPHRPPRLLCVASVTPRKGIDVLVDALARIRDLPWECVCVGSLTRDPDHADLVRARVARHRLESRIRFDGECDRAMLDVAYDASSIFVLPSHYEGYGMALTEAMARGLPVVSTTGGAIPSTVAAEASLLVPPGDAVALADAIRTLLAPGARGGHAGQPPSRLADMSAAARRHAATLPTWEIAAETFERAVCELTTGAAPGA